MKMCYITFVLLSSLIAGLLALTFVVGHIGVKLHTQNRQIEIVRSRLDTIDAEIEAAYRMIERLERMHRRLPLQRKFVADLRTDGL